MLEREFKIPCAKTRINLPGFFSDIAYLADKSIQGVGFYNQEIHVLSEMNKTIACSILHSTQELGYRPVIDLETGISLCIKEVYNYLTLN